MKYFLVVNTCIFELSSLLSLSLSPPPPGVALSSPLVPARHFGGLVPTLIRGVLKVRYLLLGGALGGSYSLAKQYEAWKENLPDTDWIRGLFKDVELDKYRGNIMKAAENIKGKANEIDIDPAVQKTLGKFADFR